MIDKTTDRQMREEIADFITESIKREQHVLDALLSACVPLDPCSANALMKVAGKIMSQFCACDESSGD